jgi:hypothetical protein
MTGGAGRSEEGTRTSEGPLPRVPRDAFARWGTLGVGSDGTPYPINAPTTDTPPHEPDLVS